MAHLWGQVVMRHKCLWCRRGPSPKSACTTGSYVYKTVGYTQPEVECDTVGTTLRQRSTKDHAQEYTASACCTMFPACFWRS